MRLDKEAGAIFVYRFLNSAMHYPCNYGHIPHTHGKDGDPIDVPVATPMPLTEGRAPEHLAPMLLDQMRRFFEHDKDLEPAKRTKVRDWEDTAAEQDCGGHYPLPRTRGA